MKKTIEALMPQFDFFLEKKLQDKSFVELAEILNENGFKTLSGETHCKTSAKALSRNLYKQVENTKRSILKNIEKSRDICATQLPFIIKHGKGDFILYQPFDKKILMNENVIVVPNCSSILYAALRELLSHKKIIYSPQENPDIRVYCHLADSAPILDLPVLNKRLMKTNKPCWLAAIFIINNNENQPTFNEIPCDICFHN